MFYSLIQMKLFRYLLIVSLTGLLSAKAQQVEPKRIYTTKTITANEAPIIDGKIDDAIWNSVEWTGDFIEYKPDENTEPVEETQFKILYDQKNLYVALRAFDKDPKGIVRRLSRRDGFEGDRINFIIDSYHDLRTAFIFTVTAAGVKGDEIVTNNGDGIDDSWNPIWYTKATVDDKGWAAEMKIPFSQLRFDSDENQVWGLQVFRQYFRTNEESVWQRLPAGTNGFVSRFGELHGIKGIKPQKQLEIQPFLVTQFDTYEAEPNNPYRDGSDFKINGGLDAKIGVTNDLTLDLTVNPDFGQVEADPGAIALDGFQIFYNERRPFFVENKNIFDYKFANGNDNVFYSRRIGRDPQRRLKLGANEYAKVPLNSTILGAAKFSGKTKNGWSIGVLETVTAKEYAKVTKNNDERKEIVEPLTNYFVGRVQKDFNEGNSYFGGIFTATNRKIEDKLNFLVDAAYTGGLDFRHQFGNRRFYVTGNFVASTVKGSKESITRLQQNQTHRFDRVDATHVSVDVNRTSLNGRNGRKI